MVKEKRQFRLVFKRINLLSFEKEKYNFNKINQIKNSPVNDKKQGVRNAHSTN